jgi:putative spermidine/putrescine transport system permease protein
MIPRVVRSAGLVLGWIYLVLIVAFLLLPIILLIPASLTDSEFLEVPPDVLTTRWYSSVLDDTDWLASAWLSLRIALVSAALSTLCGLLIGVAQLRGGELKSWQRGYLLLPMLLPHIIIATGLFIVALNTGTIGSEWLLILVNSVVALPVVLLLLLTAFDTIDPLIWTAASSLGARPMKIMRAIIVPILVVSIAIAFVMSFHSAWDETTFAVFIGPQFTPTLPGRLYSYLLQNVTPAVAAVATMLLAVTVLGAAFVIALRMLRSRIARATAEAEQAA